MVRRNFLERHVGGIVVSLLVSGITGTLSIVYQLKVQAATTEQHFGFIDSRLEDLRKDIVELRTEIKDRHAELEKLNRDLQQRYRQPG